MGADERFRLHRLADEVEVLLGGGGGGRWSRRSGLRGRHRGWDVVATCLFSLFRERGGGRERARLLLRSLSLRKEKENNMRAITKRKNEKSTREPSPPPMYSSSLCRLSSFSSPSFRNQPQLQGRDCRAIAPRRRETSSSSSSSSRGGPRPTSRAAMPADALSAATTASTSTPTPSASTLTCVSWDIDGTILRATGDVANKLHHRAFSHAWKEVRESEREKAETKPRPRLFFFSLTFSLKPVFTFF